MAKNDLAPGQSRVGFAWDAKIKQPYPAMVRRVADEIELVIPFDEADHDGVARRYVGDLVHWGDDPERRIHDYELPEHFWFADAHGFVSLVGVTHRRVDPLAGGPNTIAECQLSIRYTIFCLTPDADFSSINGLSTRIEGLALWYGQRSVSSNFEDSGRSHDEITLTVRKSRIEPLSAALNLHLVSGSDWSMPGEVGTTSINEVAHARTEVRRPRPWSQHVDLHLALHELLEVSAWRRLRFERVQAMHRRDPQRVLSGDVVGDRWSEVFTSALHREGQDVGRIDFLFDFEDIGSAGVRRWLKLRDRYLRAVRLMLFGIGRPAASIDGLLTDCGIALETIGYQLNCERGITERRSHQAHLHDIANEVQNLLPFDGDAWATGSAEMYNDLKHPDRQAVPFPEDMFQMLVRNRLVFRVWLASRLRVNDEVISRHLWRLERG